ncbi:MAG: PqqD family protein [Candidatus Aminicenantes bacterium]|nr:PqqD family protein [Candidatus Aminicenantes bacterium]
MEFLEKCYQKDSDTPFREIADEIILVPVKRKVADVDSIYLLKDEVAVRIWKLLDGRRKVGDIVKNICEEFEVTCEQAKKDISEFLNQMESIGSLIKEGTNEEIPEK